MNPPPLAGPSRALWRLCLLLGLISALVVAIHFSAASAAAKFRPRGSLPPMLSIFEKDNGQSFKVPVGGLVRILLAENGSTGYRWEIDHYSQTTIESVSCQSHYPGEAVGSAGEVAFTFRGRKVGPGQITLKEWRPWEGDSSIINRVGLNLPVQP
jgi:predicted secreted protein